MARRAQPRRRARSTPGGAQPAPGLAGVRGRPVVLHHGGWIRAATRARLEKRHLAAARGTLLRCRDRRGIHIWTQGPSRGPRRRTGTGGGRRGRRITRELIPLEAWTRKKR